MSKDKHEHKYDTPATIKVQAHEKSLRGFIDTLKQWKCSCGSAVTYDLVRKTL